MKTTFDVNSYWLERGETYVQESRTPREFHRLQERFLLDVLARVRLPMRRVVEIGCGFGRITKLVAETWPDCFITALDLSPAQLEHAREYCGVSASQRILFAPYDFYSGSPLPGGDFDTAVAIEVLLHHPPEMVAKVLRQLAAQARHVVTLDWSEPGVEPLYEHVWMHDYAQLWKTLGWACASFAVPQRIDGKQQRIFVASQSLSPEVFQVEQELELAAAAPQNQRASGAVGDPWTQQLQLATDELARVVPPGSALILVDDGQFAGVRPLARYRVLPFRERDGLWWGPPEDDEDAWRELERLRSGLKSEGGDAPFFAIAWPAFWWEQHYAGFVRRLRATFPLVLQNERLIVFRLGNETSPPT